MFEDHLCPPPPQDATLLRRRPEMGFETLVFSLLNQLTWLIAQENFIILSRRESNKSHCMTLPSSEGLCFMELLIG
jgi:hypothetical protein